jgi:heavy metal efflux system protein
MLKPRSKWPNLKEPKSAWVEHVREGLLTVPGDNYEFTQPIQMRFNEFIAGIRHDVAV